MITNNFNLPAPIYKAVSKTYQPNPDRFSVTDLIGSALIRKLKLEHWQELKEDASERLWALLGQAVDHVVSENANGAVVQWKTEIQIDGVVVVGKSDIYYPITAAIEDWKVTSVWSLLLGDKVEWERQLNCYAWAVRYYHLPVKSLRINAILRDWQKSKMLQDKDYPRIPFVSKKIPLWTFEQQDEYIKQQLEYHRTCRDPICTPEDKWEKPTTYAVMKAGRKSALRVLDELAFAKTWCIENNLGVSNLNAQGGIELKSNIEIVERPGECTRCLNYCQVRTVCPHSGAKK